MENDTRFPPRVTLTVLMENHSVRHDLQSEHGLALCLQGGSWQVIFDTGQSGAMVDNAAKLGMDLGKTTELVLSHGHYDHTGGLPRFFDTAGSVTTLAHPDVMLDRFSIKEPAKPKNVGIPEISRNRLKQNGLSEVTEATVLHDVLHLTGPIPRCTEYEDVGGPFFLDAEGAQPDPIRDDLALWWVGSEGLVIVLGCAHAGIINTVRHCRRLSGIDRVHALIGGFHLVNADEHRLEKTIAALKDIGPQILASCHCTGRAAVEQLRSAFPQAFTECHAGSVFQFH